MSGPGVPAARSHLQAHRSAMGMGAEAASGITFVDDEEVAASFKADVEKRTISGLLVPAVGPLLHWERVPAPVRRVVSIRVRTLLPPEECPHRPEVVLDAGAVLKPGVRGQPCRPSGTIGKRCAVSRSILTARRAAGPRGTRFGSRSGLGSRAPDRHRRCHRSLRQSSRSHPAPRLRSRHAG